MKLQEFACPNCHAPLVPIKDARYMFCDYCGTRIVIDDIEYYREDSKTERERIRADKEIQKSSVERAADVEIQRLKNEDSKNDIKQLLVILGFFLFAGLFIFIMNLTLG